MTPTIAGNPRFLKGYRPDDARLRPFMAGLLRSAVVCARAASWRLRHHVTVSASSWLSGVAARRLTHRLN
jgi:hypothetical protein